MPEPQHSPATRAYVILAIGIFCISFSAIFVKWTHLPGVTSGFYRLFIATLVLLIPFRRQRADRPPLSHRALALGALGGVWFSLDVIAWNTSLTYASAASATLLGNTSSVIVALAAWLIFREKLRGKFWLGLFIAVAGVLLVLGADLITIQDTQARRGHPHLWQFAGIARRVFLCGLFADHPTHPRAPRYAFVAVLHVGHRQCHLAGR